jgi:hypothetical protein
MNSLILAGAFDNIMDFKINKHEDRKEIIKKYYAYRKEKIEEIDSSLYEFEFKRLLVINSLFNSLSLYLL